MPEFKMRLPNGSRVTVNADSPEQALSKVQDFLAADAGMNGEGSQLTQPPPPAEPTLEQTLAESPLAQRISEQVSPEALFSREAQQQAASVLAGAAIPGATLPALVGGGALSGAVAPAEDLQERALNTFFGGALGVVAKPVIGAGGWLVDKTSRAIESVAGLFKPEVAVKKMVNQSLDAGLTTSADMKLAVQQAEADGIPLHVDEIVNSPSITALKQEIAINPDFNSKAIQALNQRAGNLVDALERSADAIGPTSAVTGDDVVRLTGNALDSMNTARGQAWEKGMAEVQRLAGKQAITTGNSTRGSAQEILDGVDAGEEFVSDATAAQLRRVVESLAEGKGLNAKQITARFKGFGKQAKTTNPDSWVWNRLKASLQKDLQETTLAGPANEALATVRANYANASQQIDDLKSSVLGRVYKQSTGGKEMAGSNFFKEVDRMDDDALAKFMPAAHKVSPEISGAIRARTIKKALEAASDEAGIQNVNLQKLINELPSADRFDTLFNTGNVDTQTKIQLLNRVATAQRLARSQISLKPGGSSQAVQDAAIDAGFIATGGGISGFTIANLLKRMRPAATYELLTSAQGRKLLDELERTRRTAGPRGETLATLSKSSAGYFAGLINEYGGKDRNL